MLVRVKCASEGGVLVRVKCASVRVTGCASPWNRLTNWCPTLEGCSQMSHFHKMESSRYRRGGCKVPGHLLC